MAELFVPVQGEGARLNSARALIDDLLAEQSKLTAVESFSRAHEAGSAKGDKYRELLPASPPAPGQQYAFEVNLDLCTGCKACVSACHSLNGLDEHETWRSVGLLVGDATADGRWPRGRPGFQQHVTTACHHCVDPACLNGCPVLAYDKDERTGIVRHLDDQCIGCQYCVMMCPYEVPQYSARRGIVRKCDMCSSRLGAGEPPACAQACPTNAIRITVVEQAKVRAKYRVLPSVAADALKLQNIKLQARAKFQDPNESKLQAPSSKLQRSSKFQDPNGLSGGLEREAIGTTSTSSPMNFAARNGTTWPKFGFPTSLPNTFLPSAPNPAVTLPTTRYLSQRPLPAKMFASDQWVLNPAAAHWPLVFLLALSQGALGATAAAVFVEPPGPLTLAALVAAITAMVSGFFHLGQPLKAWRAFLGWRKSWFSREVIGLAGFVGCLLLACARPGLQRAALPAAAFVGTLTVFASAMIYAATRREFWSATRTIPDFFGAALQLGAAAWLAARAWPGAAVPALRDAAIALAVITLAGLSLEQLIFRHLVDEETPAQTPLNRTARLLAGKLNRIVRFRLACGLLGGIVLPCAVLLEPAGNGPTFRWLGVIAALLSLIGEVLKRVLFFKAVAPQRMPGGLDT